jgi:hypothetical protein
MNRTFDDPGFEFNFPARGRQRPLSLCRGRRLRCDRRPDRDGDIDSWFDAWMSTTERLQGAAAEAEEKGHAVSARHAWLRAAKYAATAVLYVLGTRDPSHSLATWEMHRAAFDRAIALWPTPAAKVAIPNEGGTLEGYWLAPAAGGRRPLAILNNGSDGAAVDMLVMRGIAALERGGTR